MRKRLSTLLAKLVAHSLVILPESIQTLIGHFLGILWFDIFRFRRQLVLKNLAIVFPDMPDHEKVQLGRQALKNLGHGFIETLMIPAISSQDIASRIEFHGYENYQKAQQKGRGVLLLSVHIGSVDLGTISLATKGVPIHLLSKEFRTKWLNDFWFGLRRAHGVRFIKPHGTRSSFDILKALKAHECVLFVIDQFMGRPYGITAKFFGVETGTPYGLALFHMKTKAPVIPVYTFRDENGKNHVRFEPEVELELRDDKESTITHMVDVYNAVVERLVLRHPDQWMWVHNRWKRKI